MIHPHELPLLLAGVRDGLLDPDRVAALAASWDAAAQPQFAQYLIDCGALPPDAFRRLAAGVGTVDLSTPRPATAGVPTAEDAGSALLPGRLDETPTAVPSAGPDTPRPWGLPDVGNRYRLIRLYRGGGLGQVWLGYDNLLGRQVAVKVLRPDRLGLPAVGRRFAAEGKAAGRLEHPNIVPVYDLIPPDPATGRDAAYVMRFVAGRTLAEAARDYHAAPPAGDPRAALAPLLDAFVLVCKAVAFAHSKGVLHRDLKGANIILGEFGEVQLLDWGLAKPVTRPAGGGLGPVVDPADSDLTVTGGVVGTPAYVAPEVAAGGDASPASDVYGLGATLYAVLTGKPPADGPTPQAVLDTVRLHPPPPPRTVNPTVPVALDAVVRRAMGRTPGERYATADELARDVRAWLADEPVAAHPDGRLARLARWGRRHRPLVAAAGLLLLAVTVGLAVGAGLLAQEQQRTDAQRARADEARAATDALVLRLLEATQAGLTEMPGSGPVRRALLTAALDTYQPLLAARPDDPGLRWQVGQLLRVRASTDLWIGRPDDAEAGLLAAAELLAPLAAGRPDEYRYQVELTLLRVDHARLLLRRGRVGDAKVMLLREPAAGGWPQALVVHHYAEAEAAAGRWGEAGRLAGVAATLYHDHATDPAAGEMGCGVVLEARALLLRGNAEREMGQPAEAVRHYAAAAAVLAAPPARPGGLTPFLPRDLDLAWAECHLAQAAVAADPAAHLDEAVRLADALAARFPDETKLTRLAAEARLARCRHSGADAVADLNRSREEYERLATDPDHPPHVASWLVEVYHELARRADGPAAAEWRQKAVATADRAAGRWPELVRFARLRDQLSRAGE